MTEITINGRFLTQQVTGVQRFANETLAQLVALDSAERDDPFEILAPTQSVEREKMDYKLGSLVRGVGCFKGHLWEQSELWRHVEGKTLLSLCNTAPIFARDQIVVLHDVMVAALPGNFTFAFRNWYRLMISSYIRFGARIATVSKFSASEISRYFSVPLDQIVVLPESGEHFKKIESDQSILEKFNLTPDRYFLAASSAAPNKNFSAVINAFKRMGSNDFKLVIVGGSNNRVFSDAQDPEIEKFVTRTGYVEDEELRALYENAACFVYPSYYEGFGLPPLEAMTCGCPVIVADAASMGEVCGDAAIYCDPHDTSSLVDALKKVQSNESLREELRHKGYEQSALWKWEDTAKTLMSMM